MNYAEALDFIHSVSWKGSRPGLERTYELLEKINNPQNELKFIHVAGTNGKGSFCSMLSSVLCHEGYKVGLYTSPYVERFNERMRVQSEDISDNELAQIAEYIKPYAESMTDLPTEFELITVIAFEYFKRHECDYVVLECGMGGRLDSTNVINTSVLSVITGISLDHTAFLGDTVEKIAYEKAGIIKHGVPCLYCGSDKAAQLVINERANTVSSEFFTTYGLVPKIKRMDFEGTTFDIDGYNDVKISLLGEYQTQNAVNVIKSVEILNNIGINISRDSLYKGLYYTRWKARFEIINKSPIVISDGGHNPEGIDSAVNSVKKYFGKSKVNIVTGVLADKDYRYMAMRMADVAERVFCLTPNNPRALDSGEYAEVFRGLGIEAYSYESISETVKSAMKDAQENNRAVICLGSLYIYADVKSAVREYMLGK